LASGLAASLCEAGRKHAWAVGLSAPRLADRGRDAVAWGSSWPDDGGAPVIVRGSRLPMKRRNALPGQSSGRTRDHPGVGAGCTRERLLAPIVGANVARANKALAKQSSACHLGSSGQGEKTMQRFKVAVLILRAVGWTDVRAACSRRLAVAGARHPEVSCAANELWMRSAVNVGPNGEVARGGNGRLVRHSA
jgi:hypothetical protein